MSAESPARRADDRLSRWVCFRLDAQLYGLPILDVQEVLCQFEIEPVPGAPAAVLGVINLRGTVITVLDPRRLLALPTSCPGADACIVIVDHGEESLGLLVDRVTDVRKLVDAAIKPAPKVGVDAGEGCVHGIYVRDGELLTLLDTASLLTTSAARVA
ncbi:chemotaxis protein CheW [Sinimarinibacterium thermocellulolyticum]|uniref:Chemotaxis protein CheW n=1 Tax=Sinimarinibacterium thermocellulolyticum TaxID=3170016 RepID=A0ABV2ABG4_9GAMM